PLDLHSFPTRRSSDLRAGTIVADDLHLRVAPVRRAHHPHVPLRGQDVREESIPVPAPDGGVARIRAAIVRLISRLGDLLHVRKRNLAEVEDASAARELRTAVRDDLVAAEREIPVLRAGVLDDGTEVEREVAPL